MNDKYFKNRIENSPLGSAGLKLLNAQEKLIFTRIRNRIIENYCSSI